MYSIYFPFYLFCGFLCFAPSLGRWSCQCLLSCGFWVHRFFLLLPLLVSFTFLLFSSPVSLHLPDSFAAVHLSLSSFVSPFSLALFLLLRSLSSLHSFSSLPYPVTLPVAPVTNFPSSLMRFPLPFLHFLCWLSRLRSVFLVFPLPLLSSVLACRLRLSLRLFLHLSILLPPLSFRCRLLSFLWFLLFFFSGLFSSFVCCRPFCFLAFCRFFCVVCSLLCLQFLVPRLTLRLLTAFLRHGGGWGGGGGCLKS